MVGRLTLDQEVGVRVPVPQPPAGRPDFSQVAVVPERLLVGVRSLPTKKPATSSWVRADSRPERCQPRLPWNSLEPPGRGSRTMCSMSGRHAAMAPTVAGSRAPRRIARRLTRSRPLPSSKLRSWMSRCGTRSPARCDDRPSAAAAAPEWTAAPIVAPVAACKETITSSLVADAESRGCRQLSASDSRTGT
jgi:hypothetical protein